MTEIVYFDIPLDPYGFGIGIGLQQSILVVTTWMEWSKTWLIACHRTEWDVAHDINH